jgi:Electron transfer DM13
MVVVRRAVPVAVAVSVVAFGLLAWALASGGAGARAAPLHARGSFQRLAQPTRGHVRLVLDGDRRVLTFARFHTQAAPELFVYLVPGSARGGAIAGGVRLGRLKAVDGPQRYAVPASVPSDGALTVVVWCALCRKPWGAARLV